jgi:hypothetical protein
VSDATDLANKLTCGCPDAAVAAQALSQAVAQGGCESTALAQASAIAQGQGQGQAQAFANAIAGAGDLQKCLPAASG